MKDVLQTYKFNFEFNTKDSKKQLKSISDDMLNMLRSMDDASSKMKVFTNFVGYLEQLDTALNQFKNEHKNDFATMFGGLDADLTESLESALGMSIDKLGKLNGLRDRIGQALANKADTKELRGIANDINALFTAIGRPVELDIDGLFTGKGNLKERVEALNNALYKFYLQYQFVTNSIKGGFASGGLNAFEGLSDDAKQEVAQLADAYDELIDLQTKLKKAQGDLDKMKLKRNKGVVEEYSTDTSVDSINKLTEEFDALDAQIKSGDPNTKEYYDNILKITNVILKLGSALKTVRSDNSLLTIFQGANAGEGYGHMLDKLSKYATVRATQFEKQFLGDVSANGMQSLIAKNMAKTSQVFPGYFGGVPGSSDGGDHTSGGKTASVDIDKKTAQYDKFIKKLNEYRDVVESVDFDPDDDETSNKLFDIRDEIQDILNVSEDANQAFNDLFDSYDVKEIDFSKLTNDLKSLLNIVEPVEDGLNSIADAAEKSSSAVDSAKQDAVDTPEGSGKTEEHYDSQEKLVDSIENVEAAVRAKTEAFVEGAKTVDGAVNQEIQSLRKLEEYLGVLKNLVREVFYGERQRIGWHSGDLDHYSKTGTRSESLGASGSQLASGYGALGTGIYYLSDPKLFNGQDGSWSNDNNKIYALDLSKYNMYMAQTSEQAEQLYNFLANLEKFVLASAGYKGFGDELDGVNVESLFSDMKAVFGDIQLPQERLQKFVDDMKQFVAKFGVDQYGDMLNLGDVLTNSDDITTQFMRLLGYQGIDTSGTKLDNVATGSVIFDLDQSSPYVKVFDNVNDAVEYHNQMLGQTSTLHDTINGSVDVWASKINEVYEKIRLLGQEFSGISESIRSLSGDLNLIGGQGAGGKQLSVKIDLTDLESGLANVSEHIDTGAQNIVNAVHELENKIGSDANNVTKDEPKQSKPAQKVDGKQERYNKLVQDVNELIRLGAIAKNRDHFLLPKYDDAGGLIANTGYDGPREIVNNHASKAAIRRALDSYNRGVDAGYSQVLLDRDLKTLMACVATYSDLDEARSVFKNNELNIWQEVINMINAAREAKEAYDKYNARDEYVFSSAARMGTAKDQKLTYGDLNQFNKIVGAGNVDDVLDYLVKKFKIEIPDAANTAAEAVTESVEKIDKLSADASTQDAAGMTAKAFSAEQDVVNAAVDQEVSKLETLRLKLAEVQSAVEAKTQAFEAEYVTVDSAVGAEIASLNRLKELLEQIQNYIQPIFSGNTYNLGNIDAIQDKIGGGATTNTFQDIQQTLSQILAVLQGFTGIESDGENSIKHKEPAVDNGVDTTGVTEKLTAMLSGVATEQTLSQIPQSIEHLASAINAKNESDGNITPEAYKSLNTLISALSANIVALKDVTKGVAAQQKSQKSDAGKSATGTKNQKTDQFTKDFDKQSDDINKYAADIDSVFGITTDLIERTNELKQKLESVDSEADLSGWIAEFKQLKTDVTNATKMAKEDRLRATRELAGQTNLKFSETGFKVNSNNIDSDAEMKVIKDKYRELMKQISDYNIAVRSGQEAELDGILDTQKALYGLIDAYKQKYNIVNVDGKKPKETYGTNVVATVSGKLNNLKQKINSDPNLPNSSVLQGKMDQLEDSLKRLNQLYSDLSGKDPTKEDKESFQQASAECNNLYREVDGLVKAYDKLHNRQDVMDTLPTDVGFDVNDINQRKQALTDFVQTMYGAKATIGDFDDYYHTLLFTINNGDGTVTSAKATFDKLGTSIVSVGGDAEATTGRFKKLMGALGEQTKKLWIYAASRFGIDEIIQQVRKGIEYVREIDKALTELKKVTNETDEAYANFLQDMAKTGSVIGSTVSDLTTMASEWARLGYSMEEAGRLAKSTAVLLNVSEFKDATTASEALISTMQAFQYTADQSMHVVDILNEVGKLLPVDNYIG